MVVNSSLSFHAVFYLGPLSGPLARRTPWHHYVNPCKAAEDSSLPAYESPLTSTYLAFIKKTWILSQIKKGKLLRYAHIHGRVPLNWKEKKLFSILATLQNWLTRLTRRWTKRSVILLISSRIDQQSSRDKCTADELVRNFPPIHMTRSFFVFFLQVCITCLSGAERKFSSTFYH